MNKIDVFNNSSIILERKTPSKIVSWITIIISAIVIFLFISIFYKYNEYLYYVGTVVKQEEGFYVKLYIEADKIVNFYNNELVIDNDKIDYKIISISDDYYHIEPGTEVYEVVIDCLTNEQSMINSNLVELRFKKPKVTFMNKIIEKIKKELS
jgi:hypothetical protein